MPEPPTDDSTRALITHKLDQMCAEIRAEITERHPGPHFRLLATEAADTIRTQLPELTGEQLGTVLLLASQLLGDMAMEVKSFTPIAAANLIALMGAALYTGRPI